MTVIHFLRLKRFLKSQEPSVWYDTAPLGTNTLIDKMKTSTLTAEACLIQSITNHCLRATSITLLDGFEARQIITISGLKQSSQIMPEL